MRAAVPRPSCKGTIATSATDARTVCPRKRSILSNIGLPAKAEKHWYGESPYPVGFSGSTCHNFCPAAKRESANSQAQGPRSPIPKGPGIEVK